MLLFGLVSWVGLPQIDPLEREWIQALIDGKLDSIRRIIMEDSTYVNRRGFLHGWVSEQRHNGLAAVPHSAKLCEVCMFVYIDCFALGSQTWQEGFGECSDT